jgi:prepilin signal peptidase PulO-like enzyme (type II secretory pathway)
VQRGVGRSRICHCQFSNQIKVCILNLMLLLYTALAILGLLIGSFLAALSWRLPQGISIKTGRSFCPKCKNQISWYDNIPLLSYLILGGKCRHCKKKIPLRYPAIEVGTALVFVGTYVLLQGFSLYVQGESLSVLSRLNFCALPFLLTVCSLIILIFVTDLENRIIPDEAVFFGFTLCFLMVLFFDPGSLYVRLLSSFVISSVFLLLNLITRGRGMGLGDVKFVLFPAFLLSWPLNLVWILISFWVGSAAAIVLIVQKKVGLKNAVAFGPYMAISFFLTLVWGEKVLGIFLGG